jgi:hypothetical protein
MQGVLTGATGLEPATSGVTGRYGLGRYSRLRPGIASWRRHFLAQRPALTGYDPLPPGRACVVRVWSPWLRIRQQSDRRAIAARYFARSSLILKRPLFRARDSHATIADPPSSAGKSGYAPETVL